MNSLTNSAVYTILKNMEDVALLICGFIVGMLGTLLGIGGGVIIVPTLVLLFGFPMHSAIAASLVAIIATSSTATAHNIKTGIVDLNFGISLELTASICAMAGSIISISLNGRVVSVIFSIILFVTALIYYFKRNIEISSIRAEQKSNLFSGNFFDPSKQKIVYYSAQHLVPTFIISGLAGFISGMLGVGGGIFKVPAMNLVSKLPIKAVAATSNFMVGITALSGAIIYFKSGYLDPKIASIIIIGVVFGSKFTLWKFRKITDKRIKLIFMLFLIFVSIEMLIKAI